MLSLYDSIASNKLNQRMNFSKTSKEIYPKYKINKIPNQNHELKNNKLDSTARYRYSNLLALSN